MLLFNAIQEEYTMSAKTEQIYMDYRTMLTKASELQELASEIRKLNQTKVSCYSSNSKYWKGDSGDAFRQKVKKLENNLTKRADKLEKTANALKRAAERQYRLEMSLVSYISR